MGYGDPVIDQQLGHGSGAHAGAAVGVERERAGCDVLLGCGLGACARGDHPTDHVAAENIENRPRMKAGPLGLPQ